MDIVLSTIEPEIDFAPSQITTGREASRSVNYVDVEKIFVWIFGYQNV